MLYARDFRKQAWSDLQDKWGVVVLITLIFSALFFGLSFTAIGSIIITGPLTLGYSIICLNIVRKKEVRVETLFEGFKEFINSLTLFLINTVLIFLWSLLLFIPGLIKKYSYSMSYYILADNPNMSGNDARIASMELMKGNKWRLFCLEFSFIGWWILCALTFGILTLWVIPYMETARAHFYNSIKPKNAEEKIIDVEQNSTDSINSIDF